MIARIVLIVAAGNIGARHRLRTAGLCQGFDECREPITIGAGATAAANGGQ